MSTITEILWGQKELLISLILGFITIYLIRFYTKVFNHPKGPFPLPLIGNILLFRGTTVNAFVTFAELHKKYGSVYTLWIGTKAFVIVNDFELAKEAFNSKNNEFMGRPKLNIGDFIKQNDGVDVAFSDHGPAWASLRRVAHAAVRKYAVSEKLAYLVCDAVDDTIATIKKKEGLNNAFNPVNYIYLVVYNIIAASAFGKRYSYDDEEFLYLKNHFEEFRQNTEDTIVPDLIPILKPLYYVPMKRMEKCLTEISTKIRSKYVEHLKDYQNDVIRDFSDALIEAKEEALLEGKESAPYLTDSNLSLVLFNLFTAGSDTTQYTLRWIVLLMANHTEMQKKMRMEIESVIGDRMAVHDDRAQCHYVNAFISETLRYRVIAPMGLPHRTLCDAKIGKHNIPSDAQIMVFNDMINKDPKYWKNPETFDPMRFIENGKYLSIKPSAFIPFGIGRRMCLGEKLAQSDLFLITVRMLQSTNGLMFTLPNGDGSADLESDTKPVIFCVPKNFQIILK